MPVDEPPTCEVKVEGVGALSAWTKLPSITLPRWSAAPPVMAGWWSLAPTAGLMFAARCPIGNRMGAVRSSRTLTLALRRCIRRRSP